MKTFVHLWQYVAEFFLQWEMFQTKVVAKIKTHVLSSIICSRKSCRLYDNVETYGKARQVTDNNIKRRMRFACCISKATDKHSGYILLNAFPQQQYVKAPQCYVYTYIASRVIKTVYIFLIFYIIKCTWFLRLSCTILS